jgi:hypothetical protein
MNDRWTTIARAITSFVENPVTNLVKGVALLLIGVTEASQTFREDIVHGHVRVGHGIIIIGTFSILEALPHIIEGLDASLSRWPLSVTVAILTAIIGLLGLWHLLAR